MIKLLFVNQTHIQLHICSGDFIIADMDGAVIIPKNVAEEVIQKTEEVMATESEMRKAILDGMDPEQAYLKFRKF